MFLHSAAAIILVVPVVMPLVRAVGIDPVHFGLIVTINLGIGQQTPPVASVLMVASSIAKEIVWAVTRVNVWFIGVLVAVLLLVTYVPVTGLGLVHSSTAEPLSRAAMSELIQVDARRRDRDRRAQPPEKLNALTEADVAASSAHAIDALSADDAVRCIVLRGAGEKAFSPGNDIAEFADRARQQGAGDRVRPRHARHGDVARGLPASARRADPRHLRRRRAGDRGACDMRICGESSRFGAPIKNLGLVMAYPEMAPLVRLCRRPRRPRDPARRPDLRRRRGEGKGPGDAGRARRRGRRRGAGERRAHRRGRAAGRPLAQAVRAPPRRRRRAHGRRDTTSASTASTPRTSASATRRSSPSGSRSFVGR